MQVKKVLVSVHGDESDVQALWLAHTMTRETKGKVYVLYVIEVQRNLPLDADVGAENIKGEHVLQRMERVAKQYHCTVEAEILQARDAGPAVVQEAVDREVGAVIIAAPYKRRHGLFSLGNAVPYILKNAPCPVLLLRGEVEGNGTGSPPATH
ncbi:MAG: universal stress protein [Chloroflexota bacterium]